MNRPFDQTINYLRGRLAGTLPGPVAQMKMAPVRPDAVERLSVQGRDCREAGVLALLTPLAGEAHLLMTVRRDHLAAHAGQVSFPGGRRERDEELHQTALRETHEEVGIEPGDVDLLGRLTPLYVPPSNYCVYPFVGTTREEPALLLQSDEVARIVHVPLRALQDAASLRREEWIVRGERMLVPHFDIDGLTVWGATAMMVSELIALFD